MKYDFYDDMNLMNNFMPYNKSDKELNNMTDNNSLNSMLFNMNNNMQFKNMFDNDMFESNGTNNIDFNTNNDTLDVFNPYEGYIKGNGFRSQYVPYKNYQPPKIKINTEKEEMLVNIGQYSFMAHEMNLYLDTHPESKEALRKFQEYRDKANDLMKTYERKYGPLTVGSSSINQTPFNWVTTTWPWEV